MEYQQIYERMLKEHYFLSREMIYDAKVGVHLSAYEYERFLSFKKEYLKEHKEIFHELPLKTFNDAPLFYADCFELDYTARTYAINVLDDFVENEGFFASKHKQDLNTSRIYSEVEGSLNIDPCRQSAKWWRPFPKTHASHSSGMEPQEAVYNLGFVTFWNGTQGSVPPLFHLRGMPRPQCLLRPQCMFHLRGLVRYSVRRSMSRRKSG